MLQLFAHPFSSYCQKVLIALYENDLPFQFRRLGPDQPDNDAEWAARWPMKKMPVLVDGDATVMETSVIIEHLQCHHPGPVRLIPDDSNVALEVRMLDRVFDQYVMDPMTVPVADALRPADQRDPHGVAAAKARLDTIYAWLDQRMTEREWAVADTFTLADCAAAPALFYADWVHPFADSHPHLAAYRARLLARPSMVRCIEEARYFRPYFPLGAPDRD
jgi:glutathione S-transferase